MKSGPQLSKLPHKAAEPQPLPRGEGIAQLGASEKRRLPTGAQVFNVGNLPHAAPRRSQTE